MDVKRLWRAEDPALTVVIPSVPAYDHGPTVACLEEQTTPEPYEVLLVEDGALERSTASNGGLRAVDAEVVTPRDDDTRPPPEYLEVPHDENRDDADLIFLEEPVYDGTWSCGPRHCVDCNLAVRRDAVLAVGGFHPVFSEWCEDVEFGWRMEQDTDGVYRFSRDLRM